MKSKVNLLPPVYRRQQLVRKRIIQWTYCIGVVFLAGWAWHWYEREENRALVHQLEVLEREHAPAQRTLQELIEMRKQLEELEQQESVVSELERQRNALVLFGVISENARRTNGRLRITKLELTDFQNVDGTESISSTTGQSSLLLTGVSLDNPAVGEFLDGLQSSGIFSHVELLALRERESTETALRDYEVRCEF